jgi:pimeloyl-ACP methyl ester carboxylesterase
MPTRRAALGLLAAGTAATVLPATAAEASPGTSTGSTGSTGGISVLDVRVGGTRAYLVLPARARSAPAVLFLHWLDTPALNQDRTEFLGEAIRLAGRGVVSLLPQLTFPWSVDPVGDATDVRRIEAEHATLRRALDLLAGRPEVDRRRVAVVGHDYGAMHGSLLAVRDRRVAGFAAIAADATWENWFLKFWLGYEGEQAAAYTRLFADLEPVDSVARIAARRPVLLQFAENDFFIDAATRARFTAAAPSAEVHVYARAGHDLQLNDGLAALTDRSAWLDRVLHVG